MTAVLRPSAVSMPELGSQLKSTSLSPARRAVSKRKMPVGKGLIDWIRLCRSKGTDLTGVGGVRITVTPEQLAQHNKEEDCWTAVRGRDLHSPVPCKLFNSFCFCRSRLQHHRLLVVSPWKCKRADEGSWYRLYSAL